MNPYYWTSELVQVNVRSRLCLLAVACVLYLPTRSIVMENIGNNLMFKCKTRKMGFLYPPKHKHMTRCRVWLPALFSAGVCCRGCSCLAAWPAAMLCAVVCCGAPLLCAVSCVLWCCLAVWCRAVPPCCRFSFAGGVGLCPFPVCAVLRCAARRVVRCRCGLRCCWCLLLWCVAVRCGASLCALWFCGAALVCRGLLLCRAVFCGAVPPCGAVLLWCAVCCALLRVFLIPLKTLFWFLKRKIKSNEKKVLLYPTHTCRQQVHETYM